MRPILGIAAVLAAGQATAARAADEIFEFWANPSIEAAVAGGNAELETAHRIRDGRDDTHYMRLWYGRPIAKGVSLAGGIEQRWTGNVQEQRLLQQLNYRTGIFRGRTRVEQRFVDGDARIGVRLRQRFGVSVPVKGDRLKLVANAEGFFTLRATTLAGQTGLTGMRTLVGVEYDLDDRLGVGLGYLRAQDFRRGAVDRVGHAPMVSVAFSL